MYHGLANFFPIKEQLFATLSPLVSSHSIPFSATAQFSLFSNQKKHCAEISEKKEILSDSRQKKVCEVRYKNGQGRISGVSE